MYPKSLLFVCLAREFWRISLWAAFAAASRKWPSRPTWSRHRITAPLTPQPMHRPLTTPPPTSLPHTQPTPVVCRTCTRSLPLPPTSSPKEMSPTSHPPTELEGAGAPHIIPWEYSCTARTQSCITLIWSLLLTRHTPPSVFMYLPTYTVWPCGKQEAWSRPQDMRPAAKISADDCVMWPWTSVQRRNSYLKWASPEGDKGGLGGAAVKGFIMWWCVSRIPAWASEEPTLLMGLENILLLYTSFVMQRCRLTGCMCLFFSLLIWLIDFFFHTCLYLVANQIFIKKNKWFSASVTLQRKNTCCGCKMWAVS